MWNFALFARVIDLGLDPMTLLDPYPVKLSSQTENELSIRQGLR